MESGHTGRDHINALFGGECTDRIPVRSWQSLKSALERASVTAKEARTEPDKFVKAMVALQEVAPSDAVGVLVGDVALFANMVGMTFQDLKSPGTGGSSFAWDKESFRKLKVRDPKEYDRLQYYVEVCEKAFK